MTDAITIKNMHKLDISEVVGSIELPTSVYGNRSITLETLGQYLGTGGGGGGGSGEVTKVEFDKEVTDRKAADTLIQAEIADLDNRVNTLESNPIKLKTINSESLVGTGNIKLPTQADVVSTADSKVNAYKATVDVELGTIKTNITTLDTSVSDLNTKTASLDAGQLTLTTNLAQEVTNRTSADTALGVRITNLDTKVTATDTKLQTLETETTDLDTRVTALEDTSSEGLKTINGEGLIGTGDIDLPTATEVSAIASAEVETYKRVVDPKIETLEEETTDLDTRVSSLENASGLELKTINGETITGTGDIVLPTVADVEAVDDDLQVYKGVVDPQLTTLTTDLSNLNTEVDTLTTEVESQEVDISNLDARVEVLETKTHTDEHVKMTANGVAGYLADFVDGTTLVNNSGKLTVEAINGVQTTKDELNYLQGVTSNIQAQINDISSVGVFKGAVNNLNELYNISPAPNVGDYYIVLEDSDYGDVTTIYMFSDSGFQFLGEFTAEIRDFETDPLNLETEATGVLPIAHIPTGNTDETVALGNHTHANATTTAAGFMSTTDKTKLNAIATGATKNDTDANLRDRSTHTGSQSFTTLNDVAAVAQIPDLDAAKIATGTFAVERIPTLDVNTQTTGVLNLDRLPTGTVEGTVALGNHTHANATELVSGFMSALDKAKFDARTDIIPQYYPNIEIDDPPSDESIKAAFDKLLDLLVDARVFTMSLDKVFKANSQGIWLDASDLSTMFQDAAGTIPVTDVGQPVGLWQDKSGKGNHAKQTIADSRPTLQKDANGNYYLFFDGVDDFFVIPKTGMKFTHTNNKSAVCTLYREDAQLTYQPLFSSGTLGAKTGTGYTLSQDNRLEGNPISLFLVSNSNSEAHNTVLSARNLPREMKVVTTYATPDVRLIRINKKQRSVFTSSENPASIYNSTLDFTIGTGNDRGRFFGGEFYGMIASEDADVNLLKLEEAFLAKVGVNLIGE